MRVRSVLGDFGGAFGDLGTLLPYVLGAVLVAGMAPSGVFFGFGLFLVATGIFYRLPIPVQPMKAVGAVMLTGALSPAEIAAAGLAVGAAMLFLGATGLIVRIARLVPQSVTAGLQLGLGCAMALYGFGMIAEAPWIGFGILALVAAMLRLSRLAAVPVALVAAVAAGVATGRTALPDTLHFGLALPPAILPAWSDFVSTFGPAVLPQLPLTVANAVLLTAVLARTLFPETAARASERNLSLGTGVANLALAPLGALPMCHGAGGFQAQYRFGARTGLAPALLGGALLATSMALSGSAASILAAIPLAGLGALLAVAGADLALSRRLFDARPDCWPAIGLTAGVTAFVDPAAGLAAGWTVELGRTAARQLVRRFTARS